MNMPAFRQALLAWFDRQARDLPWRRNPTPYHTWVSEIMLQQTQAITVAPYYERFLARFPTIQALADAPLDDVLKAWEGLGYYRRARHLHQAAQIVIEQHEGRLPASEVALRALPGIGRYTAGAILSIAFGQRTPVLDGNVKRVLSRLADIEESIDEPAVERELWSQATILVDDERPGAFNEALMELGATICLAANPQCLLCPVSDFCEARQLGTQYERPVRNARRVTPHYDVVAGVISPQAQSDHFLIARRPAGGMLGGLWEFPGGKQEPGESLPSALKRELEEELGIAIDVGRPVISLDHAYTHFRITLHAFYGQHTAGEPRRLGVDDWRWVTLNDLDHYAFARTDRKIIEALRQSAGLET